MGKNLKEEDLRLNIIVNGDPARKEIGALDRSTKDLASSNKKLRAEMKQLKAAGGENKARIAEISAEIKKNNETIKANEARTKQLRAEMKLTSMTTAELSRRHAELRNAMRNVVPGTPQWKQLRSELQAVTLRMAQLRIETTATEGVMCRMATNVNKYIGTVTATFAALAMYGSGLRKAIDAYSELDEAMSNARKTTNMTRREVEELNDKLAKIDTRTAQNELLSLARIGGKLGIAKNDIEGFTRAADIIKIALGKDLGDNVETTIGQIGKLVNVFHVDQEFGIEQGMMKTAAAVNELGKSSVANEANIVEFTRRVGGVGSAAKISIANIAGLGATLDAVGVTMEVAGTSMSQVITGMFRRTDAFAAAAKMSVKDFKDLMAQDMNEAIIRFAEGMGKDGAAMNKVVAALDSLKLDGQRATGVLTALAQNTEMVRKQQEIANQAFNEGTSCLKEFNVMNNSVEAITEKRKKQITAEAAALGESLIPAYHESLSAQASLIKATRILIEWLIKNRGVIIGLVASYAAYKTVIFAVNAAKKTYASTVATLNAVKHSYLLAVRATRAAMVAETGATKAATIATRLFGIAIKTTPLGWVAAAIGVAAGALAYFATRANSATAAQKTFNEVTKAAAEIEDEHGVNLVGKAEKIRQLMRVVENEATSEERRIAAIKELQDLTPGGIDLINQETIANGDAAKSVKAYTEQLILQATIKAALQKKQELIDQAGKDRVTGDDKKVGWFRRMTLYHLATESGGTLDYDTMVEQAEEQNKKKYQDNLDKQIETYDKIIEDAQQALDSKKIDMPTPGWDFEKDQAFMDNKAKLEERFRAGEIKSEQDFNKELLKLEVKALKDRLAANIEDGDARLNLKKQLQKKELELKGNPDDFGGGDSNGKWSLDKDAAFLAEKKKLRQAFADGEIATEREYQGKLLDLEVATLKARLAANKESGAERSKLEIQLADKLLELKKNQSEITDADFQAQKQKLRKQFADGEIATEQEYQDKLLALEIAFLQARLASNKDSGEARIKLETLLTDKLIEQKKREQQQANAAEDLRIQNITDATERENAEYERRKKQYAGNAAALEQLAAAHARRLAQIELQKATAELKQEEDEYKRSRHAMQAHHKLRLQETKLTANERKRRKREQAAELAAFDEAYFQRTLTQIRALSGAGMMAFRDLEGVLQSIDLDTSLLSEQEKNDLLKRIQEITAALAASKEQLKQATEPEEKKYSFHVDDEDKSKQPGFLFGFSQDDWDLFFENLKSGKVGVEDIGFAFQAVASAASEALNLYAGYDKMMTAKENAELKKYKKNNDAKKKALQSRLDAGLMSQEQYDAEVERMDAENDKKQEEIEIKQAKRKKAMSLAQVAIDTASAIGKAIAMYAWPWSLIPIAFATATGAAQAAMIASTPIAGAEEGSFFVERAQDGRKFNARLNPGARGYIDHPTVLVGENGMEYVIPNEAMQNPTAAPIINAIEAVRQKGRLRDFDFTQVMPAMMQVPGYVAGGPTAGSLSSTITLPDVPRTEAPENKAILEVLARLAGILEKPIKSEVSLMGRGGFNEKWEEYERMKKRGKIGK